MKFKDYFNRESNSNRIYSKREIREMKLKDFFTKENELISQYNAVGFPMLSDLKNSPNVTYVEDPNEVFGGRWESVGVNGDVNTDGNADFALQNNPSGSITGGAASIAKGQQKLQQDSVKVAPDKMIQGSGAENDNKNLKQAISNSIQNNETHWSNLQKWAASHTNDTASEMQYYGHSIHLAEGKEPSKFMKANNDFYKISDITDPITKAYYIEKARKTYKFEPNDTDLYNKVKDMQVVVPKKNSQLYSQIINSGVFQDWIAQAYLDLIAKKAITETSLVFPPNAGVDAKPLSRTLHIADMVGTRLNSDGSMTTRLLDGYDFKYMDADNAKKENWKGDLIRTINNNAYAQQEKGQLGNYLISTLFTISPEDIQKYVNNYKNKQAPRQY